MTYDDALREAAELAASAPIWEGCEGDKHGNYTAYRHHRCRCPETVALFRLQRKQWDTSAQESRKAFQRLLERNSVRPEVVEAILEGRRREVHAHYVELNAAFQHAVWRWGRDWRVLAEKLDYGRHEVQRRLRRMDEENARRAEGENGSSGSENLVN